MVFSDPLFLFLFLPVLLAIYLAAPRRARNAILLIASLGFYAIGEHEYTLVMLGSITLNFLVARALESERFGSRKLVLCLGIALNLIALTFFKYANFLGGELSHLLVALGLAPLEFAPIHLPLGISFFVFQGMSYLIDVYRREIPAEKSLFRFALFKALFPQLIAGPIVRYPDVARQLELRIVTSENLTRGSERFVVGLGKKMLLANPTGAVADQIFTLPANELSTPLAWLGLICYGMQIYFDFSGYSDMAIGLGRVFGFEFRENFNYPYTADGITDFWRRWHLSLSTWFRDYLYIPLGGNRLGPRRTYLNLFIVFGLCGLWHGASWNFLIWGMWHGALLAAERAFLARWLAPLPALLRHVYTLAAVGIGWVFFRAETLTDSLAYLGAMLSPTAGSGQPLGFYLSLELMVVLAAAFIGSSAWPKRLVTERASKLTPRALLLTQCAGIVLLLALSEAKIAAGAYSPFIYFRF